jgi:plastocyanin
VKRLLALSACLLAASAASAAPAFALERVEATFFAEYTNATYTIDQGEVVVFANKDPFLAHGVDADDELGGEPVFSAPVVRPKTKELRLLTGAPFLTTGTYDFHCPLHASMTSTLIVNANGTPLPPDATAPVAGVRVKRVALAGLLRRRKLTVTVNPAEVSDAALRARAGGVALSSAQKIYLSPGRRRLVLRFGRKTARALKARVAELRSRGRRALKLRVSAALTDVAGNQATSRGGLTVRLPVPPPPQGEKKKG